MVRVDSLQVRPADTLLQSRRDHPSRRPIQVRRRQWTEVPGLIEVRNQSR